MKIRKLIFCFVMLSIVGLMYARKSGKVDGSDYVPDKETAIRIAEAIWLPIYGKQIYKEKPFVAVLDKKSGVWTVNGTLPPNSLGGVAYIEIQKSDCKVLKVYHEK